METQMPQTTTSQTLKQQAPTVQIPNPQTTAAPELEAWLASLAWQYETEREYYEACGGY